MVKFKICPACKCINPEIVIFCENYRTDLSSENVYDESEIEIVCIKNCPNCNTDNRLDAVVCTECDQPLDEINPRRFVKTKQTISPVKPIIKSKIIKENSLNGTTLESPKTNEHILRFVTHEGKAIEIQAGKKVILGKEGDVSLDPFTPYPTVSREHLIVEFDKQQWFIMDNKSTNGAYLNGKIIKVGERYLIKKGDVINLSTKFALVVKKYEDKDCLYHSSRKGKRA